MVNLAPALRLAASQHNVITFGQALKAGLSPKAVLRMHDHGWQRSLPGVYYTNIGGFEQALQAALLWAGPRALVSHRAAARLYQLDGFEEAEAELTIPRERSVRKSWVHVHRGELSSSDSRRLGSFPLTSPTRTLLDLAGCADGLSLAMAVEHAWRTHRVSLTQLTKRFEALRASGRPGVRQMSEVLDDCRARRRPLESGLEVRLWWLLKESGLPLPRTQFPARDEAGGLRIDFAYPQQRLALEADSFEFHGDKKYFEGHCERLTRLAALGWRVIHITKLQLANGPKLLSRIRAGLEFQAGLD